MRRGEGTKNNKTQKFEQLAPDGQGAGKARAFDDSTMW